MKIAIIGGCGSSGTTLLTHLVSRHPAVRSGPELNFFNHAEVLDRTRFVENLDRLFAGRCLAQGYKSEHRFLDKGPEFTAGAEQFREWLRRDPDIAETYLALGEELCRAGGETVFVEKTPTNIYSFKELAARAPDIPLIHLIRDGRDVAASLMGRGKSFFQAGSRWLYDVQAGFEARSSPRYLELRYEDLVTKPEGVMRQVFRHLGLPFIEDLLQDPPPSDTTYNEVWSKRAAPQNWGQTPDRPISLASVGRYRERLTAAQLSMLDRIELTPPAREALEAPARSFRELLEVLGYESNVDPATVPSARSPELLAEALDYLRRGMSSVWRQGVLPGRLTTIAPR